MEAYRLSVHRSSKHIYAQITSPQDNTVVAAASSLDPEIKKLITDKTKGKVGVFPIGEENWKQLKGMKLYSAVKKMDALPADEQPPVTAKIFRSPWMII